MYYVCDECGYMEERKIDQCPSCDCTDMVEMEEEQVIDNWKQVQPSDVDGALDSIVNSLAVRLKMWLQSQDLSSKIISKLNDKELETLDFLVNVERQER